MANIVSPTKPLSLGVSYGFLGGSLASRRMRKLAARAGLNWTTNVSNADILIAHSAGCWQVESAKPHLLLIVGLPLARPGWATSLRANRARTLTHIANRHLLKGGAMILINLFYLVSQPRRNLSIISNARQLQEAHKLPQAEQVVFIINSRDPWTNSPAKLSEYTARENWSFIGLPGSHDDVWEQPERYIEIINHYARLLA